MRPERPALFLDRDGVINEDLGHVYRIEDFHFLPDVLASCRRFHEAGYKLVVVTNQAGIAKGYYSADDLENLNRWMSAQFSAAGAPLAGIYYCPHHPDGSIPGLRKICDCRKPAPGLLLRAQREIGIDMKHSILVGDNYTDILAAQAAGVGHSYLMESAISHLQLSPPRLSFSQVTSLSEVVGALGLT